MKHIFNIIQKNIHITFLLTLTGFYSWSEADSSLCPIGFKFSDSILLCYRLKPSEKFEDKYINCAGNKYNLFLAKTLIAETEIDRKVWTDYKSLYPGGIFVDWSDQNLTIKTDFLNLDVDNDLDEDFCLVWSPSDEEEKLVRCDEKHYRFCIIDPYDSFIIQSMPGCENNFIRFTSPRSTCLSSLEGVGGGSIRATWSQAQKMCNGRNATLLQEGWRYANYEMLWTNSTIRVPLGIFMSLNDQLLWSQPEGNIAEVNK